MKYIDYQERKEQGTFLFPIAFYHVTPNHPRYNMPYHWHTHYEILRVLSGNFRLTLDDATHVFCPGDIVFITGGVIHGGSPQDCVYECIVFNMEFFLNKSGIGTKIIDDILHRRIVINTCVSNESSEVKAIVDKLCRTLQTKEEGYEFTTQGYLFLLMGAVLNEGLYHESKEIFKNFDHLKSIKQVLTYISENYGSSIDIKQLAKIAGMNPNYFCRYFKSMTERTPMDYVNYFRIESACEILSTKNVSVRETAIRCGYSNENYFIRAFRKYKGITPKQYAMLKFNEENTALS